MGAAQAIQLQDLEVEYSQFRLGPVSVSIAHGERVALVGENGAGKSTMLRTISGLQADYAGSVEVEGVEVRDQGPSVRLRVGFLPERVLAFGWMTVAEHLEFLAAAHPGWDADYAAALRQRLILPADTKVANLSKGMAVKLSFLTAEAFRPPILLLDEPTSGVDPVMRREIVDLIVEAVPADSPRAVVFSSHILEDVEAVAERVVLIRQGRLIADTSVEALRSEGPRGSVSDALYARLTSHE